MSDQGKSDPYSASFDTNDVARDYQERMRALMADGKTTKHEAAYQIAREDNDQLVKINTYKAEQLKNVAAEPERPRELQSETEPQRPPGPDKTEESTLTFFEDRQPHSPDYARLKKEQAESIGSPDRDESNPKDQSQEPERPLTFYEDRNHPDPGRSR